MLKTLYVSVSLLILTVVAVTIIACSISDSGPIAGEDPPLITGNTVVAIN